MTALAKFGHWKMSSMGAAQGVVEGFASHLCPGNLVIDLGQLVLHVFPPFGASIGTCGHERLLLGE